MYKKENVFKNLSKAIEKNKDVNNEFVLLLYEFNNFLKNNNAKLILDEKNNLYYFEVGVNKYYLCSFLEL